MAGKFEVPGVGWFNADGSFLGKGVSNIPAPAAAPAPAATPAAAPKPQATPAAPSGPPGFRMPGSLAPALKGEATPLWAGDLRVDPTVAFGSGFTAAMTGGGSSGGDAPAPALKPVDAAPLSRLETALSGLSRANSGGGEMSLDEQRTRAFLDAPDSISGLKAAKGVMAKAAGIESANPQTLRMKDLEAQAQDGINRNAMRSVREDAEKSNVYANAPAENPLTEQMAGNFKLTPQLMDQYLQSDAFKGGLDRSDGTTSDRIQFELRDDPDLSTALSSYAALGMKPPKKPEEQLLNSNLFTPQGKTGNTLSLGFYDAAQLAPLNSSGVSVTPPSEFRNPFTGGAANGYWQ